MNEEVLHADPVAATSAVATETAPVEVVEGVEQVSDSPAETDAPDKSSPEENQDTAEIREIVESAVNPVEPKPEAEEAAPTTDEPEADVKAEEQQPEALSQESRVKIPNEQRPEWQKLTAIGDKLGPAAGKEVRAVLRDVYRHEAQLVRQITESKPAVEVLQEMRQSAGTDQGLANMRQLIRSFDSDPGNAVPMLETLLNDAKKRAGLVLNEPALLTEAQQLDQQVADGLIEPQQAEKRKQELLELQKAKTITTQTQQQQQAERDRQQRAQSEAQQQRAVTEINNAEATWTAAKAKSDPDFAAVQTLHGAFAKDNSLNFWNENHRLPNAKESVEILEKSLKQAKAEAGKFRPAPKARAVVRDTSGSSTQHRQQPRNAREQIEADIKAAIEAQQ